MYIWHYQFIVNTAILFSKELDPVRVLAECWALVWELVEGYVLQYQLVNTAILFSKEVDPVGVLAECWQYQPFVNTPFLFSEEVDPVGVLAECWSLVRELVECFIWHYELLNTAILFCEKLFRLVDSD